MDLIADFCRDHHALNNTPPKRRQAQEKVLREFELSLAERPLTEAGTEELERFLIAELERGLHVNTVRFELNMIRPFYTWLWRRQYIDGDRLLRIRDVRPPRGASGRSTPKPYDRRELDRFYAELDERWPRSSDNMVQRWKQGRSTYHRVWKHGMRLQIDAIIALALYQGMRGKEIYDATEDDVHPLNRYVIVRYGTRKGDGRQKYREVPMQERTRAAIGAWLEWRAMLKPGHDSLWLSLHPRWALIPMRYSRIRHLLLTIGGGWQLHRFRHTCATEWLRAGMPLKHVSRWLGHSTVSRTECYVQIIRDDLEREATRAASNFDRAVAPRQEAA